MLNLIVAWFGIVGLVVVPFAVGVLLEQKVQPANRELGSRLRHY
jgi:hypothetical protein